MKSKIINYLVLWSAFFVPATASASNWVYSASVSNKSYEIKGNTLNSGSFRFDETLNALTLAAGNEFLKGDISFSVTTVESSPEIDRTDLSISYSAPISEKTSFSLGYFTSSTDLDLANVSAPLDNDSYYVQFVGRQPIAGNLTASFKLGLMTGDYDFRDDSGRSEGLSYGISLKSLYGENILSLAYEYADLSFNTSPGNDMDEKISGISLSIARSF